MPARPTTLNLVPESRRGPDANPRVSTFCRWSFNRELSPWRRASAWAACAWDARGAPTLRASDRCWAGPDPPKRDPAVRPDDGASRTRFVAFGLWLSIPPFRDWGPTPCRTVGADADRSADGLWDVCRCGVVLGRQVNRWTRWSSEVDGVAELSGAEDRTWEPGLPAAGGLVRLDGREDGEPCVSVCRRAVNRSDNDPRDGVLPMEVLGEEVCGDDLVSLWAPSRLPILSVPLGLPTSDGCGRDL